MPNGYLKHTGDLRHTNGARRGGRTQHDLHRRGAAATCWPGMKGRPRCQNYDPSRDD